MQFMDSACHKVASISACAARCEQPVITFFDITRNEPALAGKTVNVHKHHISSAAPPVTSLAHATEQLVAPLACTSCP